jgi:tetratricopeptide (TPR) repeat protein
MDDYPPAVRLVEEGRALSAAGDVAGAERAYLAAIELEPAWSAPLFNLGLLYKYQRRWAESLEYNRRASALSADDQGAWWNRGIAATALGLWPEARECWVRCGVTDPGGADPPDYRLGRIPVRLEPDGDAEVVWGTRLDPARVQLRNIPFPLSPYRWGDVVLTDGAAEGHRLVGDRTYPVFNVLQRLVPSTLRTFIVELATFDQAAIELLDDIAYEAGGAAEHWGSTTRRLCRECSLGTPHVHTEPVDPAHPLCGLVARTTEDARAIVERWLNTTTVADVIRWYEYVDPSGGR